MSNQANKNEKEKNKSFNNSQASGSEYHKEHAGHVEGYGEIYPEAKNVIDTTNKND
ncbi:hypothetical protein ABET41_09855 [Metabacillus fastidiosus]|uniref:DUF4025 domain-containing protein n=1 Tax=Metabacillus fastidiosus TaxID=1458 RepID=A0ABU6NZK5_9BACI|nr:hypothetical protein [Metabacillus fastidiosus]MED4402552.1 hypothetical protein [Metabacillus fastidiosus]MED4461911.1 hypothetical protein [Metabacillus fastidiosus]